MVHEFSKKKYIKIVIWKYILTWFLISAVLNFFVMVDGSKDLEGIIFSSGLAGLFTICILYRNTLQKQSSQICTYDDGNITYKFSNKDGWSGVYHKRRRIYDIDIYQINDIKDFKKDLNHIIIYANITKSKVAENVIFKGKKKENLTEIKIPRIFEKEEEFFKFLRENTTKEV